MTKAKCRHSLAVRPWCNHLLALLAKTHLTLLLAVSLQLAQQGVQSTQISKCPGRCASFGTCNEELGRCDCPLGHAGTDCSQRLDPQSAAAQCRAYGHRLDTCTAIGHTDLCLNACHGKGTCVGGFCKCLPGHFGMDCALTMGEHNSQHTGKVQMLAWQGYMERPRGAKVYVYELPPKYNAWTYIARVDRPLLPVLMQRLQALGARTSNGHDADYYLIPFLFGKRREHDLLFVDALKYIQRTWPFWHGDNGSRHLIVAQGDHGRLSLPPVIQPLLEPLIVLQSWGLTTEHAIGRWQPAHRSNHDIVVPSLSNPDELLAFTPLHPAVNPLPPALTSRYNLLQMQTANLSDTRAVVEQQTLPGGAKLLRLVQRARNLTLFFSGRMCGDRKHAVEGQGCVDDARPYYSGYIRQRVFKHHHNRPGYLISHSASLLLMAQAKFCLAPPGFGYGRRSVHAMLMGCIPVTIGDHVLQPFEPELPWSDWSVPVAEVDIPRMHEILAGIGEDKIQDMQERLYCAAQHVYYSGTFGAIFGESGQYDAVVTLLEILRMRLTAKGRTLGRHMYADEHHKAFTVCRAHTAGQDTGRASSQGHTAGQGTKPTSAAPVVHAGDHDKLASDVPQVVSASGWLCNQNRAVFLTGKVPAVNVWCPHVFNTTSVMHKDMRLFYGWPGGAACAMHANVGQCARAMT